VYLFPFLFLLVAANVPEILTGYRATRAKLAGLGTGLRWLVPGNRGALSTAGWGSAAACALGVIFATGSLLDYNGESQLNPFWPRSYHGAELVRSYAQADVERAFELLEDWADPGDWVLLDSQSVFALRLHLEVAPVVSADAPAPVRGDISMAARGSRQPLRRLHNGVQYYYSRKFMVHTTLESVIADVRYLSRYYHVKKPRRVWLIRGGWSQSFMDRFDLERLPERPDPRARRESGGMLFEIELDQLRRLTREGA
jgi:hypothetical protein